MIAQDPFAPRPPGTCEVCCTAHDVRSVFDESADRAVRPIAEAPEQPRYRFQNSCDGMRNARLKRDDEFSHAMIIVSSAIVSSS